MAVRRVRCAISLGAAELIADIEPIDVGWFSHENPFAFDVRDFRYAPDARHFLGRNALDRAILACDHRHRDDPATIGVDAAPAWNRVLIAHVEAGSGRTFDMRNRGGTLCLDAADIDGLAAALTAADCR